MSEYKKNSSNRRYPFRRDDRFLNYPGEQHEGFAGVIRWTMRALLQNDHGEDELRRQWVIENARFEPSDNTTIPQILWIGHSTFLIRIAGITILTDPIFGYLSFLFPRLTRPGIPIEELPPIDVVLISHNHFDHLDVRSLRRIARRNPKMRILVPWGDRKWLRRKLCGVSEYMWWDAERVSKIGPWGASTVTCTFLPAYHSTRRGLLDINKSLWGSWMIQAGDKTIYFAGDTAYESHFKSIAEEFPSIDLALLPISPCEPRECTRFSHISAEEAGIALLDLGARAMIPMHWGAYHFGEDHPLTPIKRLETWWNEHQDLLKDHRLKILKIGESFVWHEPHIGLSIPRDLVAEQDAE